MKIKLLLIDDDEDDFILLLEMINEIDHHKYSLDWVSNYELGLVKAVEKQYDVYLVDYDLGQKSGIDFIREAKRLGCDSPFIVHSGRSDFGIDQEVMNVGGVDFLVKGTFTSIVLDRALRYVVSNFRQLLEIKMLNTNLEKRVRDRTIILEEAIHELNIAKEELAKSLSSEKELNELKSRFVSMASHEFRTPLATMLSSLSLVESYTETNDVENQTKHINRIKNSIKHLSDMLNDVLSLSKLEEGGLLICLEEIDVKEFLVNLIKELDPLKKDGQSIIIDYNVHDTIVSDKKFLRHILMNLISNAIKFSHEYSEIKIWTSVLQNVLEIKVIDNGIGISKEDQKHLFERFFRASNAENIQGTGLGLSIVSKYVEMLGGKIECESELNKGSVFKIKLPKKQKDEQDNFIN